MFEILGILFLILIFVLWLPYIMHSTKAGAPYVPLEPAVVSRVIKLAAIKPGETFCELGSGDGRIVIAAALQKAIAYGVEIVFFRVWYSRIWIHLLRLQKHASIIHQDIFEVDLSSANIVCLYLLQETNLKLQQKLDKELEKGTRVLSIAFHFPGWKPVAIDPRGPIYGPIYLYIKE